MLEPINVYHGGSPVAGITGYRVTPLDSEAGICEASEDHPAEYEVGWADEDREVYCTYLCGTHVDQFLQGRRAVDVVTTEWADRILYGPDNY